VSGDVVVVAEPVEVTADAVSETAADVAESIAVVEVVEETPVTTEAST
jgi:hypothetical protein